MLSKLNYHKHSCLYKAISCVPFPSQVTFMSYHVNGQYIMEGMASSFLFLMGGLGFIILDKSNAVGMSKLNRFLSMFLGFVWVLVSFFTCRVFLRMKLLWVSHFFKVTARYTNQVSACCVSYIYSHNHYNFLKCDWCISCFIFH